MSALQTRTASLVRRARREDADPILEDLRSFAQDLGIVGSAAMGREELVESLRQRYVLDSLLHGTRRPARN